MNGLCGLATHGMQLVFASTRATKGIGFPSDAPPEDFARSDSGRSGGRHRVPPTARRTRRGAREPAHLRTRSMAARARTCFSLAPAALSFGRAVRAIDAAFWGEALAPRNFLQSQSAILLRPLPVLSALA